MLGSSYKWSDKNLIFASSYCASYTTINQNIWPRDKLVKAEIPITPQQPLQIWKETSYHNYEVKE